MNINRYKKTLIYNPASPLDNVAVQDKMEQIKEDDEEEKPIPWEASSFEIKDLDSVIKSLTDDKYELKSKKSLKNFREWLDNISDKLMEEKRKRDDTLFDDS